MALIKIADFNPNYKEEIFSGYDIKNFNVYTEQENKVGDVHDALLDKSGRFRYLVIDTGFWIFGKKVLLPIGYARIDYQQQRIYVTNLTKEQAENLPKYDDDITIDYDYEEQVRNIYRGTAAATNRPSYNRDSYNYDYDPEAYKINEDNNQLLKLYEERLVVDKQRYKTGDVSVGKRVEAETAQVSVPVEKERVVVERRNPSQTTPVKPGAANFREGEVVRMEVHEESVDIQKEAFVSEEVSVRKEVERDVVKAKEKVRREELDVKSDGETIVGKD